MDPSASLCLVYDSLQEKHPPSTFIEPWYVSTEQITLTPQYTPTNTKSTPLYSDITTYNKLQDAKKSTNTAFIKARNDINPFEKIGNSIFTNKDAVKLANIDAVYHISGKVFTFDNKTTNGAFVFCDVSESTGFSQYMQYRFPNNKGYTIIPQSDELDTTKLTITHGDIYTNWENFIKLVLEQQPEGVDLVTCSNDTNNQEFLTSRLLMIEILIGIGCSKEGGNFIVKVFDTVTLISAQILFILSQCFHHILIFRPVTSDDEARYVICKGRKRDIQVYYQLILGAISKYQNNVYLSSIFSEQLPPDFEQWLTTSNNESINSELQNVQNILSYMKGDTPQIPQFDINKFLIIWNLPDTPPVVIKKPYQQVQCKLGAVTTERKTNPINRRGRV